MDSCNGLVEWTDGMDSWNGLVEWLGYNIKKLLLTKFKCTRYLSETAYLAGFYKRQGNR